MESAARPMETVLDAPLRDILPLMQDRIVNGTTWMGVPALKSPTDAWIYQQLLAEVRPATIIELGVNWGGSTLYLAHLCDLLGVGRVIGIGASLERVRATVRDHQRIDLIEAPEIEAVDQVRSMIDPSGPVLVIEDSSHTYDNTLAVCREYGSMVTPGSYLIVEDTICHHGLDVGPSPGPYEAVQTFLAENDQFALRRDLEAFVITWNPIGYLQRR